MLLRGRSKDRARKVTPPGPVYMSNDEFGDYLKNLRNTRVARPAGARPLPTHALTDSERGHSTRSPVDLGSNVLDREPKPRSASALSHKRASLPSQPYMTSRIGRQLVQQPSEPSEPIPLLKPSQVVPSDTYMERGQRWMEKEEAVSLRGAMEDMDLKMGGDVESRIHAAAQDEASELVWQHQHITSPIMPDAPYRYKDHLRKNSYQHARTKSVGRHGGAEVVTGLARDMAPRSVSGSSASSGEKPSQYETLSEEHLRGASLSSVNRASLDSTRVALESGPARKSYGSIGHNNGTVAGARRKSSTKRNISGEVRDSFTGEQIWEEPEQEDSVADRGRPVASRDVPAPLRLKAQNPLNRVHFSQTLGQRSNSTPPEPIKRISNSEIHRNPPSQSRNPHYTANPVVNTASQETVPNVEQATPKTTKDGLEVRSDEIRHATSMRLKDRSPKLPTPTAVSDKPGRPIVSFEADWKPREADSAIGGRRRSPFDRRLNVNQRQSLPARADSAPVSSMLVLEKPSASAKQNSQMPATVVIPPACTTRPPRVDPPRASPPSTPAISSSASTPPIPTISIGECMPAIPTIICPDSTPPVPTINLPDTSPIPMISIGSNPSNSNTKRPLPVPKPGPGRNASHQPQTYRGHWSPAAGKRATATCHQCQLPIEGRVVKLSGGLEHFHPECFICFCCGTGLESLEIHPEPPAKRMERVDRIRRRIRGESLPEIEGQTMAEDGDERQRYYCHLDFHENYAPRCKHCKTSIIGEHLVALGEHWHYGHFFCAECGDPFEKGITHIEKDGYAWCLSCQTRRTERQAPKCKQCKKPVIGEYVQALGGEWHEKCFKCATCKSGFQDGAFYPKETKSGTVVLCIQCIERELKS